LSQQKYRYLPMLRAGVGIISPGDERPKNILLLLHLGHLFGEINGIRSFLQNTKTHLSFSPIL
jgi:hypothetical protein